MTCAHPIPVPEEGMPPTIRYVLCERESGHVGDHRHVEPDGSVRGIYPEALSWDGDLLSWDDAPLLHIEPDGTVTESG